MDSFIDKLAQKFTAQEMIKANSSAEAEELKRSREQVKQYETCLEEMKNVNESMKESLSTLEKTLNIDFEKMGEAQAPTADISAMLEESMAAIKKSQEEAALEQSLAQEQLNSQLQMLQDNMNGRLAELLQNNAGNTAEKLDELQEMQNVVYGQINGQQEILENIQNTQNGVLGQLNERLQNVESSVSGQLSERLQGVQDTMSSQMQGIQDVQSKLANQLLGQMQDMQDIQEGQSKLSSQVTGQLQAVQDKILNQIKAERAFADATKEENVKFSEAQIMFLKELAATGPESTKEHFDARLNEQREQIVDYVHKENVKVYRNVQAVVVDESNKQTENIGMLLNRVVAKNQLLMRLVIASVACSGLSLAAVVFLILRSLGII